MPDWLAAFVQENLALKILGIDVGLNGALALIDSDGALIEINDMPTLKDGPKGRKTVSAALLANIVYRSGATMAFVEMVNARPGEGAVGAFSFGRSRGVIEGCLAACGLPCRFIAPAVWKRAAGIPPGNAKDASRSEAIRRWPSMAAMFARAKDDGRAESALIGWAGMRKGF